jgi:hypothetical protein
MPRGILMTDPTPTDDLLAQADAWDGESWPGQLIVDLAAEVRALQDQRDEAISALHEIEYDDLYLLTLGGLGQFRANTLATVRRALAAVDRPPTTDDTVRSYRQFQERYLPSQTVQPETPQETGERIAREALAVDRPPTGTPAWHVLRSWNPPDPFAPDCGCTVADCGHVIPSGVCDQHNGQQSIRSAHPAERCPSAGWTPETTRDRSRD